jgi:hypothetical protein
MALERNVGGLDRKLRSFLAIVFFVVAARALQSGRYKRGLLATLALAEMVFNVTTGFCPGNALLGIDTTGADDEPQVTPAEDLS